MSCDISHAQLMCQSNQISMTAIVNLLRYTPLSKRRSRIPWETGLLIFISFSSFTSIIALKSSFNQSFPNDILTPYPLGKHGSTRTTRDVSECQHIVWENRTYEEFKISTKPPKLKTLDYEVSKFADIVHEGPLRKRYAVGTISYVQNPYYTLSISEPYEKGGCTKGYFSTVRSSVQDTVKKRKHGCHLAANGGFFNTYDGECLGNIVSDGRIIQSAHGIANANFGIRQDGTIVVGYISEQDLQNRTNLFRQLITGVIWLVRNGTNYVNESKFIECSEHEDTGKMDTFVDVLSARSAIGHDSEGRVVMAQVEGQTHVRGVNLYEFADLLIRRGVVNAINLDGGGSNTFVEEGLLLNYPSDHCQYNGQYRCPREVSTIVCVHDVECLEPDCSGHGSCDLGTCSCDRPWMGPICNVLNCSMANCSSKGKCLDGKCRCDPGWTGNFCEKTCPHNHYGAGCNGVCYCFGKSHCDPVNGDCICPSGYTGYGCWDECSDGYYGVNCKNICDYPDCSGHGKCSKTNGSCHCDQGWTGVSCNTNTSKSLDELISSSTLPFSDNSLSVSPSPSSQHHYLHSLSSSSPSPPQTNGPGVISSEVLHSPSIDNIMKCNNRSDYMTNLTSSDYTKSQTVAIVIITTLGTIIIHVVLCVLNVYCRNGMGGVALSRTEIRRELMEKREWEQLVSETTKWSTDSMDD